jgi:hypothetical protein
MEKSHWVWKAVAPLLGVISIGDLIAKAAIPATTAAGWAGSMGLAFATTGVLQYAFGWPKLSRLIWRVFGPMFSLVMIWPLASSVGWLGTRLAVKQLSLGEQVATAGLLATLALYGFILVVPLYRLGEWKYFKGTAQTAEAAALQDTFA